MGLNVWCIFASLLLVSVGASRYDQGPQKFYDVSSDSASSEQNENKEVILYLTPDQVRALEAGGAVVRPAEDPENDEAEPGFPAEPQVNEDQEEDEQDENEDVEEEEEPQQEEQVSPEDTQSLDTDFEEILRILNEQQVEEEEEATEEQALNVPQVEEENTEAPRNFSPRITLRQQQQEQRYLAPAVAKKEQILKSYSYIRYQPNEQPQRINVQLFEQQQEEASEAEDSNEDPQTEVSEDSSQGKKKYKLIPYEVEENAEEQNAEKQAQQNSEAEDDAQGLNDLVTPLLGADRLTETIIQRKNRLLQNEQRLQTILRELKASPKYNDQKYAIEIERLRANAEKQRTLTRAESIAKTAPALIKQQLNKKRRPNKSAKQGKGPDRDAESQQAKPKQPKSQRNSAPSENARPIPVPVIKVEKTEVQKPIPVPVDTSKRVSVRNVYVKTRTDKPYIVSRKVPVNRRQTPIEVPKSKPERITILRHIWEH